MLATPGGTWNMPLMGYESACTAPTLASPKAMPPIMVDGHVVAGPHVAAVEHGGADALADQVDALVGEGVRVHGRVDRDGRLDVVDEGVDAGGGGDVRRAAERERRVDEGDVGMRTGHEALLHVELLVGEDGDGGALGAGAREVVGTAMIGRPFFLTWSMPT